MAVMAKYFWRPGKCRGAKGTRSLNSARGSWRVVSFSGGSRLNSTGRRYLMNSATDVSLSVPFDAGFGHAAANAVQTF